MNRYLISVMIIYENGENSFKMAFIKINGNLNYQRDIYDYFQKKEYREIDGVVLLMQKEYTAKEEEDFKKTIDEEPQN